MVWQDTKMLSSLGVVLLILLIILVLLGSCGLLRRERLVRKDKEYQTRPTDVVWRGRARSARRSEKANDPLYRITVHGRERTFFVHLPESYSSGKSTPLLLVFHGGRGTAEGIASKTGFNKLSDTRGFIVVYPNGYKSNWNDGRGATEAERVGIDDVAFVKALLADVEERFTIDRKRIYAAGLSNGGMFVNRLGCELSDRFAAIAFVVGPITIPIAQRCEPRTPISVLGIFGTDDPLIPWRGGEVQGRRGGHGPILGAEATIDLWARKNACRTRGKTEVLPTIVEDGTVVKKMVYSSCREGREVVLYTIEGGGHGWPPAPSGSPRAGKSSRNLEASQVIWSFFSNQPPR